MYSNTMMVLLNSRMVYGMPNDVSTELSFVTYRRSIFFSSQVGVSVTHAESDSLEHPVGDSKMVGVTI